MWETVATAAVSLGVAVIGVWGSSGGFGRHWLRTIREELEVLKLLDPANEHAAKLRAHVEGRLDWYTLSRRERWAKRGDRAGTVLGWAILVFVALDWVRVAISGEPPTELTVWSTVGAVGITVAGLLVMYVNGLVRKRAAVEEG